MPAPDDPSIAPVAPMAVVAVICACPVTATSPVVTISPALTIVTSPATCPSLTSRSTPYQSCDSCVAPAPYRNADRGCSIPGVVPASDRNRSDRSDAWTGPSPTDATGTNGYRVEPAASVTHATVPGANDRGTPPNRPVHQPSAIVTVAVASGAVDRSTRANVGAKRSSSVTVAGYRPESPAGMRIRAPMANHVSARE